MTSIRRHILFLSICLLAASVIAVPGQSRRNIKGSADSEGTILNITAWRTEKKPEVIKPDEIALYENGVEQKIKSFSFDPSPSRIVLIVDNSMTLGADVEKLKGAVMEFAYEIFQGDELFVIAYDEKPEIIQEWTDDAKKLETSLATFRKKGNPYLFDALKAASKEVLQPLMPGTRKTAIVVIGDGLDRGSTADFEKTINDLQENNITVYALQLPDRTRGAYRRNQPKATAVIQQLTESTGGSIFPLDDAQAAAKAICDELRHNRYLLSYSPVNTSSYDHRTLLVVGNEGINIRTKTAQPPNIK